MTQLTRAGLPCWLAIFALLLSGCGGGAFPSDSAADQARDELPVRVLVLDDEPLAEAIRNLWATRGEGPIDVRNGKAAELVQGQRRLLEADVVVYPSGLLGELSERELIAPLSDEARHDANLAINDVLELPRLRKLSWNRSIYAAPLGAPQLLLMYRRDLLKQLDAQPPQTWVEYAELAGRLAKLTEASSGSWAGACEPGGDGWRGQVLLARAASYGVRAGQVSNLWKLGSMEPQIAAEPFQRALREMAGAPVERPATPQDCFRALVAGRCGMAVCWPSAAALRGVERPSPRLPLGCTRLPGARQVYDGNQWQQVEGEEPVRVPLLAVSGRLVSVTEEARRRLDAAHRLVWLSGKEWSGDIGPASESTMVCRHSQMTALPRWTGESLDQEARRQFAETVRLSQQRMVSLTSIRIPGRHRYLQALDDGVQRALKGESAPGDALQQVARQWRQITEELGVEGQSDAYAHHLDL